LVVLQRRAGTDCHAEEHVAPSLAGIRGAGLQQNARLEQAPRGAFALLDNLIEPFTMLDAESDDVFLFSRLFRGHGVSPILPQPSIRKPRWKSTI